MTAAPTTAPVQLDDDALADYIMAAANSRTMNTARSQQAATHILGPSDLGSCRNYLRLMVIQHPYDEANVSDSRWPAFIGTAVGDHLEEALALTSPEIRTQVPLAVTFPSGRQTRGTADALLPDRIVDFKAKDGLATVRRTGPSFGNLVQINTYLLGAIQAGLLPEDAKWSLVYYDRSGREAKPYVVSGTLDMDIIAEMESRLDDVEYAVAHDEEAPRDNPEPLCRYCPFYFSCRGGVTDSPGLITDPGHLDAVEQYRAGIELEKEAKRLKDEAKAALVGAAGSTGKYVVRWIHVNEVTVPASHRSAYDRLDLRPLPGAKA
jgi:hypothetical protein